MGSVAQVPLCHPALNSPPVSACEEFLTLQPAKLSGSFHRSACDSGRFQK